MMEHGTIEASDLVERYLLGRLSPDERADFETHFIECPECLERLELGRRLRQGLREVAAEDRARWTLTLFGAWLLSRRRAFAGVLAVLVAAAVVLPWVVLEPRVSRLSEQRARLATELELALAPQVDEPVYTLSPERASPGEEPSTRITFGQRPEWVTLSLELPPFLEAELYRVRLDGRSDGPAWSSAPVRRDGVEPLALRLHSSWLADGTHVVAIDALPAGGEPRTVARFAFRVRRTES